MELRRTAIVVAACLLAGLLAGVAVCVGMRGTLGRVLTVEPIRRYEPVELVPISVQWPKGSPATVQTVVPPPKEARRLERDFNLDLSRTAILGKYELPAMPDGGEAVVDAPDAERDAARPVRLTVRANPPPMLRIRWEPEGSFFYGIGSGAESGADSVSYAGYVSLPRLLCIRDRLCGQVRAGYEHRRGNENWILEAGISIRFR